MTSIYKHEVAQSECVRAADLLIKIRVIRAKRPRGTDREQLIEPYVFMAGSETGDCDKDITNHRSANC